MRKWKTSDHLAEAFLFLESVSKKREEQQMHVLNNALISWGCRIGVGTGVQGKTNSSLTQYRVSPCCHVVIKQLFHSWGPNAAQFVPNSDKAYNELP